MALEIYQLRTSRGLTEAELASRVGTTQSVIARLEDADYEGHSLRMLQRIEEALGARLSVHFDRVAHRRRADYEVFIMTQHVVGLDTVVELLSGYLEPSSIPKWLLGHNAHLGGRRPIDLLREGNLSDVIQAIEALKSGAYA